MAAMVSVSVIEQVLTNDGCRGEENGIEAAGKRNLFIMKESDAGLNRIYQQNPATRAFLIEVALDRFEEIFNEWDPAPFVRRDLNPALYRYLEVSQDCIPLHHPVELLFTAPAQIADPASETCVREGLATYLNSLVDYARRDLQKLNRNVLVNLCTAALLLSAAAQLSRITNPNLLITVVHDGLTIGAWVFSWELISLFFFRRAELRQELKKWQRLAGATVSFSFRE
jgi:hypothetical protein